MFKCVLTCDRFSGHGIKSGLLPPYGEGQLPLVARLLRRRQRKQVPHLRNSGQCEDYSLVLKSELFQRKSLFC
jgi:hypothetical protein